MKDEKKDLTFHSRCLKFEKKVEFTSSMSLIFSRACEYGLQAMLYIATKRTNERVMAREIAEALQIPVHYLAKILEDLSHGGLLISHKGAGGGFALGKPATKISLLDIVNIIDGPEFIDTCALGFPGCSELNPCPAHPAWKKIKAEIIESVLSKKIAYLSPDIPKKIRSLQPKGRKQLHGSL